MARVGGKGSTDLRAGCMRAKGQLALGVATREGTEGGTEDECSLGRVYLKCPCQSSCLRD